MVREVAVDFIEQQFMFARELLDKAAQDFTAAPLPIPRDMQVACAVVIFQQAFDIDVFNVDFFDGTVAGCKISSSGDASDPGSSRRKTGLTAA